MMEAFKLAGDCKKAVRQQADFDMDFRGDDGFCPAGYLQQEE